MPRKLRKQISKDAARQKKSIADTIRHILCAHYGLDCPPLSQIWGGRSRYNRERDEGNQMLLVRMQPELFALMKLDAAESDRTLRDIIIETLEDNYRGGAK
jgi:predicted HicB family RNase H-like nuclease